MKILVTGGASGLGKSITEKLVAAGHELVITYCYSKKAADALVATHNVTALHCDFGNQDSIQQLTTYIASADLDVLVNNALTGLQKQYFHKTSIGQLQQSFQSDVLPTLAITQASLKTFRKKKFGKIITILSSSIIGNPPIGWSEYTANKMYLLSMNKSWAVENGKHNVTSNCISPAFMLTPLNKAEDERIIENMTKAHPLKQLLKVEEVADAVTFFVTASQQINGTNMVINAAAS